MTTLTDTRNVVKAKDEIIGITVQNVVGEDLGEICEIMLDKRTGRVAYAVLESGSFLGIGGKLFALPWHALKFDPEKECFILNVSKDELKNAPGFDKDHWPDMADAQWGKTIFNYYGTKPYWE